MKSLIESIVKREEHEASLLESLIEKCPKVFIKKLSTNDRDWARLPNKHQAGVYVPPRERDSGFFPSLRAKENRDGKPEILEAYFRTEWPQVGKAHKTRLVHYKSKGEETHLTGLPKEAFRDLAPASFLAIGKPADSEAYQCITVDSVAEEAEILTGSLSIGPDFKAAILSPKKAFEALRSRASSFLEQALKAFQSGTFERFVSETAKIPTTEDLARMARERYLERENEVDLDPFRLARPGDAVRQISRGDEYEIFKDLQLRAVALELIRVILGSDPKAATVDKAFRTIIAEYPRIDALLLSASQQRKSRAGYSFEHQVERMLRDGKIPFEKQVVLDAKKRPDFILPNLALFKDDARERDEALILSAKTTLRERWKQVQREMINCDLFLATVDENIAGNAIEDMREMGIALVVPESLKESETTEYKGHPNVIDFKTFFEDEIRTERSPRWKARGIGA